MNNFQLYNFEHEYSTLFSLFTKEKLINCTIEFEFSEHSVTKCYTCQHAHKCLRVHEIACVPEVTELSEPHVRIPHLENACCIVSIILVTNLSKVDYI